MDKFNVIIILSVALVTAILIIIIQAKMIRHLTPKYRIKRVRDSHRGKFSILARKGRESLSIVDGLDGVQFEKICCQMLYEIGFKNVRMTATTGDYGVDILADKDGKTYAIQCKCYSKPIGVDAVQQAYSGCAFYRADVPVVLTNRGFTDNAQYLAKVIGVTLWNRNFIQKVFEDAHKRAGRKR